MKSRRQRPFPIRSALRQVPTVIALVTHLACSIEQTQGLRNPNPTSEDSPTESEASSTQGDPSVTEPDTSSVPQANGWSTLLMTSDYAETEIDAAGHFVISRNNCWVRGDGVMDVEPWIVLTPILNRWIEGNRILSTNESDPNLCTPVGTGIRDLKGDLEFKKEPTKTAPKFKLLSFKWEQGERKLCGALPPEELPNLQSAVKALNQTLSKAFQEDCTITPQ